MALFDEGNVMPSISGKSVEVVAVPTFDDNYVWLIQDGVHAAVVDPGDAAPVAEQLRARRLVLTAILLTHRHADHIGGVEALLANSDMPVYGPRNDPIDSVTRRVSEGDTVELPELGIALDVLDVPGHTRGHVAYVARRQNWLFCGDMLFGAGCGRMFEGTPEMMVSSLAKFAALPDETLVYGGHEYTLSNLRFAQEIEPGNPDIAARMRADKAKRDQGLPTVPSTMKLEKATNPFLRNAEPAVIERMLSLGRVQRKDPTETFAALREWKNTYR